MSATREPWVRGELSNWLGNNEFQGEEEWSKLRRMIFCNWSKYVEVVGWKVVKSSDEARKGEM